MNQRKKISPTPVTSPARKPPVAPPAYRPQPLPRVLQRKLACSVTTPPTAVTTKAPKAPAVYKPNKPPLVLQAKRAVVQPKFATPMKGAPVGLTRFSVIQRAMAAAYEEDRNEGDILEGQKNFKTIKKSIAETAETGPAGRFRLHTVEFDVLPGKVQDAIHEIMAGDDPANCWETYRGDFHCNRGGHLPETATPAAMNQKQQNYHRDAQAKDRDKRGFVAQYAEFHVTGSGLGKAFRLLYDYVNDQFYISLTHYNIWSDAGGGERNPFFRVINIH